MRMCAQTCQYHLYPRFPTPKCNCVQQAEITPRQLRNYSADSPRISNAKAKGVSITKIITPRIGCNYSTCLSIRPAFSNLSCSPLGGGINFVELKYNNIPIGDTKAGKLLHRNCTYSTLGIYGGKGCARRFCQSMRDEGQNSRMRVRYVWIRARHMFRTDVATSHVSHNKSHTLCDIAQQWWHEAQVAKRNNGNKHAARFTLECSTQFDPEAVAHNNNGT